MNRGSGWVVRALVDPHGAAQEATDGSVGWRVGFGVLLSATLVGAATLPRQRELLRSAFQLAGFPDMPGYQETMLSGIWRLILADRLVPDPTVLLAALAVGYLAAAMLGVSRDRKTVVWAVVWFGIAPVFVGRVGELLLTYLAPIGSVMSPGDVITLPHRFVTGPLLAWRVAAPPPGWLEVLDARCNLITLWSGAIWAVGLRVLDGARGWSLWHFALPAGALAAAAVATWILGPFVAALILRLA